MGRKLNLVLVERTLREKEFRMFTPGDFSRIFTVSSLSAQKFLERYRQKGVFKRVKKGLYVFAADPPSLFLLANKLYSPSYISLETALSFHRLIPETVYSVTSITTKPTRLFPLGDVVFSYSKIKKAAFTGYTPLRYGEETILMAEKEKALCDLLYFVNLGKKSLSDRLAEKEIDFRKLRKFAQLFGRKGLERLIDDLF